MATGEKQVFWKKWISKKKHYCIICNKHIKQPLTWSFAHILNKHCYPKQRLDKNNIALVCSIKCHNKLDLITAKIGKPYLYRMYKEGKNMIYIIKNELGKL